MSRFNVQGFPTILVFGADKDKPSSYDGARTASAIESFALDQLETNVSPPEVTELTGPVCLLFFFFFSFFQKIVFFIALLTQNIS